ncbi:MAG: YraN family protein [Cyclobacteriaceae bacterium]|nr:YraN family protein [Cyclobacteriaceae bacterium]
MSKNKELGIEGEQLAKDYLKKDEWLIMEMNYRYRRSEIDLIASKNDLLIFVEVKTRSNTAFGLPEQFVDKKKAENIMKAADHYILEKDWTGNIRFDIISIIKKESIELEHIEDAFY